MTNKQGSDTGLQVADSTPSNPSTTMSSLLTAAKGSGILFTSTLIAQAVRFVMGIVLARALGPEQLGLYNLSWAVAALLAGIALLGLPSALVRYVSIFSSKGDSAGIWATLQMGIGIPVILSVIFGIILYIGADPIFVKILHQPQLLHTLRFVVLFIPFIALINTLAAATRGFKKMEYTAIARNISQPTIKLIVLMLFLVTGLTVGKALTAHLLSIIVTTVMLLFFLNKLFSFRRRLNISIGHMWVLIRFSLPLYLSELINIFRKNIQTILLGALNSIATVGIFTVVSQVNLLGSLFHSSIATVSMPIVSELYTRGRLDELSGYYKTMTKWTFTLNFPLFLIILQFPTLILSIFGEDYIDGGQALIILAWGNLVVTATGICGVVLNMTGNTFWNLVNSIVMSVLMIGLNFWLIPIWGLIGAAVATLLATSVVSFMRLLEVFFILKLSPYDFSFIKPITAGLVSVGVSWAISQLISQEANIIYQIINLIVILALYVAVLLLLGLSSEDKMVLSHFTKRIIKKSLR